MSNSAKFWNALGILIEIGIFICDFEVGMVFNAALSFLVLGYLFDNEMPPPILCLTFTGVFLVCMCGVIAGVMWLYKHTIQKFNVWLNGKNTSTESIR